MSTEQDADTLTVEVTDDGFVVEPKDADKGEPQDSAEQIAVATQMGWVPLDKWDRDPATWRPASAFIAEVPQIVMNIRAKNRKLEDQMGRVIGEVAKLTKTQRQQADADLDAALDAAIDAGDKDEARKIRDAMRQNAQGNTAPEAPPELQDFEARNATWLGVDKEATAYVKMLDRQYAEDAGGVTNPTAHLKRIEAAVKRRFPELFEAPPDKDTKDGKGARVLGPGGRAEVRRSTNGEMTVADMTATQRRGAETMGVSHADWVKQYNRLNADQRRA